MFEACKNVENGIKWFITFKDLVNVDNFVPKKCSLCFPFKPENVPYLMSTPFFHINSFSEEQVVFNNK